MNALDRAMTYLNIRPRSCREVEVYLKSKGYEDIEIKDAIDSLKVYRYLDDAQFAHMYIQYSYEKGRGDVRIRRELLAKGVSAHVIEDAFYEMEDEDGSCDQFEIALEIGRDVVRNIDLQSLDYKERQKIEARVARRLASRGFATDLVYRVIKELKK